MKLDDLAYAIAAHAHAGQVDKAGQPYIGHVERVAAQFTDPEDRAVAFLHDVLEDTTVTAQVLLDLNVPAEVVADVELLTHLPNEPRADYYGRVLTSDRARRVKLADLADNSDPTRLAILDDATRERLAEKYHQAYLTLTQ